MKPQYLLPIVAASLALANAEPLQDTFAHPLTISLKTAYLGEEIPKEKSNGDESFTQKIVTEKVSNKQILEGLLEAGVITGENIKGWALAFVTDDNADVVAVIATKKNELPVNVSANLSANFDFVLQAEKSKFDESKGKFTANYVYQGLGGVAINLEFEGGDVYNLEANGAIEAVTKETEIENEDIESDIELLQKVTFESLTGEFSDESQDESGLVTGSVNAGSGKKIIVPVVVPSSN